MSANRVLIVEDDPPLREILTYNIGQVGYDVSSARDGQEGLHEAERVRPDLVLLDVMLPNIDGVEVCRRLRNGAATRDIRVLMLTAKSDETNQLNGLAAGADDYVTKPFSMRVLIQRMKALLRRNRVDPPDDAVIACCGIQVDKQARRVSSDGQAIDVTPTELALLDTMVREPGRAFTRSELIDAALGGSRVLERTVDVHIMALRKKLAGGDQVLQTVRGIGYRFCEPANRQST